MKIVILLLKILISLIVGQTLFFKFSGAEESVYIFSTLGVEPWGRLALGALEFIAVVLLWIPAATVYALILIWGMMSGAVASHLLILGVEIKGDKGELFILAVVTWVSALLVLCMKKEEVKKIAEAVGLVKIR